MKTRKIEPQILLDLLKETKANSAWERAVKAYAVGLIEDHISSITTYDDNGVTMIRNPGKDFEPLVYSTETLEEVLLNGAENWRQYSWGGCSLIYDSDIAGALCTPSELKRTRNGELPPNSQEEWLDVQARALYQAYRLILNTIHHHGEDY